MEPLEPRGPLQDGLPGGGMCEIGESLRVQLIPVAIALS